MRLAKTFSVISFILAVVATGAGLGWAQEAAREVDGLSLSPAEAKLYDVARQFSKATLVDGKGWEEYESNLHTDFTRWSAESSVLDKQQTVGMIRPWWESGNRTGSSEEKLISVKIVGGVGVIRKRVTEHYVNSKGNETGSFSGYVTHVWVQSNDTWRLLAATIQQGTAQ